MSDNTTETPSVAEFLEAQARHLWSKAGGKLTGLVTLSQSVHGKCYSLYIVAPSVEKYDMRLRLLVWNDDSGLEQYLLETGDYTGQQVANSLIVFGKKPPLRPFHVRLNREQILDDVGDWLRSKTTRSIIDSLIAHVNESEQRQ
jgi:hypothetical protein